MRRMRAPGLMTFCRVCSPVGRQGAATVGRFCFTHCYPARLRPAASPAAAPARLRRFCTPGAALVPRGFRASLEGRRALVDVWLSPCVRRA